MQLTHLEQSAGVLEAWWPKLPIERSGCDFWPGSLFCVVGQDTLLS